MLGVLNVSAILCPGSIEWSPELRKGTHAPSGDGDVYNNVSNVSGDGLHPNSHCISLPSVLCSGTLSDKTFLLITEHILYCIRSLRCLGRNINGKSFVKPQDVIHLRLTSPVTLDFWTTAMLTFISARNLQ